MAVRAGLRSSTGGRERAASSSDVGERGTGQARAKVTGNDVGYSTFALGANATATSCNAGTGEAAAAEAAVRVARGVLDNRPLPADSPALRAQAAGDVWIAGFSGGTFDANDAISNEVPTAAAMGTLTPMPCVPVIPAPWSPGASIVTIQGQKALTDDSKCNCVWAGSIEITDPGTDVDAE